MQELLTLISKARRIIYNIKDGDPLYRRISNVQTTGKQLDELYNQYKGVLPAYVCVYCDGVKVDGCKACIGTGVISEFVLDSIPQKIRSKRGMEQPF